MEETTKKSIPSNVYPLNPQKVVIRASLEELQGRVDRLKALLEQMKAEEKTNK